MNTSDQDLKSRYEQLSDEALLELWRQDTLTETAKMILRVELEERRVPIPVNETQEPGQEAEDESAEWVEIENNGKWLTIAQYSLSTEAHIFRCRLEAEDIPAVVADEHQVTANWLLSNALGGVKVKVPEAYAQRAYAILQAIQSGDLEIEGDDK